MMARPDVLHAPCTAALQAPKSFDDFERCITEACAHAPAPALSVRAATIARRSGACDIIVTAALVHNYASFVACQPSAEEARLSACLLSEVFEDEVLQLLGELPCGGEASPPPEGHRACERLARFVSQARSQPVDPMLPPLPLARLMTVARRMSRDAW